MSVAKIRSKAFQRAALESESHRILGLLCLLGMLMLYALGRAVVTGESGLLFAQVLVLALAIAYEAGMLMVVKRALQEEREVPTAIWIINVCIETQIPTIAMVLLIESGLVGSYEALVAPVILLYFLFIVLSTLRLSPILSILTGLVSALGYLAVVFIAFSSNAGAKSQAVVLPLTTYFLYAGLILAGGIVAAIVARQIRNHVFAALREAELQGELERVNHDLDIARSIQQGLLPATAPDMDEFDVAGWNQPADQTGGDYFDWLALPNGQLAISLGDATGHGIGPALVSASCRAYARANFIAGNGQDDLLDRLNRLLADDLSANRFVTFAVVFLDPVSSHFKVLSAGHGPILWYRSATDKIENLEAQGIPLGMIAGIKYAQATVNSLEAGDMLVLVTDGFYEWENPDGEEFGVARVEAVIRECRDCSADEVIEKLRAEVLKFCKGTTQKDDLTAVVLKRHQPSLVTINTEALHVERETLFAQ